MATIRTEQREVSGLVREPDGSVTVTLSQPPGTPGPGGPAEPWMGSVPIVIRGVEFDKAPHLNDLVALTLSTVTS